MTRLLSTVAAAALLAVSTPALAQSKKELADADQRLASRLEVLEQRFLTGDPAAERLLQRLDQLDTTVRALTGELERVTYERDQLRGEVEALATDLRAVRELESRMRLHLDAVDLVAAETRNPAAPEKTPMYREVVIPSQGGPSQGTVAQPLPAQPTAPQPVAPKPVSVDVAALPDAGRTKLAEGDFRGARRDFQLYLDSAPGARDAGEIHYWLGETHYVEDQHAQAAQSYIASMKADRAGTKAPDAMVRLGASLAALGKTEQACQTFRQFESEYPGASYAVREKARMERSRAAC